MLTVTATVMSVGAIILPSEHVRCHWRAYSFGGMDGRIHGDGPQQNRTYIAQVFASQDTLVPPHPDGGVAFPNPIVEGLLLTVQFNLEVQQQVKAQLFNTNGQFVQDLTGRLLPEGPAELLIDERSGSRHLRSRLTVIKVFLRWRKS